MATVYQIRAPRTPPTGDRPDRRYLAAAPATHDLGWRAVAPPSDADAAVGTPHEPAGDAAASLTGDDLDRALEAHRRELTGFCYRMLGSGSEAETPSRRR